VVGGGRIDAQLPQVPVEPVGFLALPADGERRVDDGEGPAVGGVGEGQTKYERKGQ
jgi:hypothetical protein